MNYSECTHLNEPPKPEGFVRKYCDYILFNICHVNFGAEFLDVGCGNGEYVEIWKGTGLHAKGIDKYSDYDINGDIETKVPFEYSTFDVVHSKSLIEHTRDPMSAIRNMWFVLKLGGICIMLTPDIDAAKWSFWGDIGHVSPFNANKLYQLFEYADFQDIEVDRFTRFPHGWKKPLKGMLIATGTK